MCSVSISDLSIDLAKDKEQLVEDLLRLSDRYAMIKNISILPDFHLKNKMEVPSSTTFAIKDHICFSLSSPEQNCGMTLVRTPILKENVTTSEISAFFSAIKKRIPLPPRKLNRIGRDDLHNILLKGAKWGIEEYGMDPSILQSIENNGCVLEDGEGSDIGSVIPDELINIGLSTFCHIGDGNHFLEMQYVDEILNESICDDLGIVPNQIVIMYHSGSGYFGSLLGRYYAHRTKNTLEGHLRLFPKKLRFHLSHSKNGISLLERIKSYLLWNHFVFMPADSVEGQRAILSFKASTNFAYANRLSIFNEISLALQKIGGFPLEEFSIFWDHSHNSIYREDYEGDLVWMHRHNTSRILPRSSFAEGTLFHKTGQPTFIPGFNTTSSFLAVAGDSCRLSLNSVDHGAGKSIESAIEKRISREITDRQTMIFNYQEVAPELKTHNSDEGIARVIECLSEKKIVRPIARLRPLAALKG